MKFLFLFLLLVSCKSLSVPSNNCDNLYKQRLQSFLNYYLYNKEDVVLNKKTTRTKWFCPSNTEICGENMFSLHKSYLERKLNQPFNMLSIDKDSLINDFKLYKACSGGVINLKKMKLNITDEIFDKDNNFLKRTISIPVFNDDYSKVLIYEKTENLQHNDEVLVRIFKSSLNSWIPIGVINIES